MKKLALGLVILSFSSVLAFAAPGASVIAKYGNWYQGDDDLYAQCMVVSTGRSAQREIIFQGMAVVSVSRASIPAAKLEALEKLRRTLSTESSPAPYSGYNFLKIDESAGPDIEILGQAPGVKGNTSYDQYFNVSPQSDAAQAIKSICNIDEAN